MKNSQNHFSSKSILVFLLVALVTANTGCISVAQLVSESFIAGTTINYAPKSDRVLPSERLDIDVDSVKDEANRALKDENFELIEKIAREARNKRQRVHGGYWKLDSIYEGVSGYFPEAPDKKPSSQQWAERIKLVEKWKHKHPQSATAGIALASAYNNYAWFARGHGLANTVSEGDWEVFHQRIKRAEQELMEVKNNVEKCPRWYFEMQTVALALSWSQKDKEALFVEAIAFEPNYLASYLNMSQSMLPKWAGSKNEWADYVKWLPSKLQELGTDEAEIIYFMVVMADIGDWSMEYPSEHVSNQIVKKGFHELDKKYGVSNLRLNQFAFFTVSVVDVESAQIAFDKIGDQWNKEVWSESEFFQMKKFAKRGLAQLIPNSKFSIRSVTP
ncbi:MAG: hypothetical protein R2681_17780 [Pyrinomonadaceae bacterium]